MQDIKNYNGDLTVSSIRHNDDTCISPHYSVQNFFYKVKVQMKKKIQCKH